MNNIETLCDFVGELAETYPRDAGETSHKRDAFFKKYLSGLKGNLTEDIDFNRLYKLVLRNNPESSFAPSPNFILNLAGLAKRDNSTSKIYKSGELVSFCYRENGTLREYAYPKSEEAYYAKTLEALKETAEKFWFGTVYDEPV